MKGKIDVITFSLAKGNGETITQVRCMRCGHVSWWRSDRRYVCAECGSKKASAVDLVREALREQRAEVQRRLVTQKRIDALFIAQGWSPMKNKRVLCTGASNG